MATAGTAFSNPIDGESLIPLLKDSSAPWRDDLLCETNGHYDLVIGRMVVTGRHKYVETRGDMSELYDLEADPIELNNLIGQEQYAGLQTDMRHRLSKWLERTADTVHL
ncbi:MAG: sulfatase/phosphatase domain-containing protein [Chloroflexota bacterium]